MTDLDDQYRNHPVFLLLDQLSEFYDNLSFSAFSFLSHGIKDVFNIDSTMFDSMQGTMRSIKSVSIEGRINDAYALLRKYFDFTVINAYTIAFIENHDIDDGLIVAHINGWVHATERIPGYRALAGYLRKDVKLSRLNAFLIDSPAYKRIRKRCNDHTHYNAYYYAMLNDSKTYLESRKKYLDDFHDDLMRLFVMHFAYVFFLKSHCMMASDYIDALEMGQTPETESQYWVAPFVQDAFDQFIQTTDPELSEYIKTTTDMKLK